MGILKIFDSVLEIFGWYRGDIWLVSWRYLMGILDIFHRFI